MNIENFITTLQRDYPGSMYIHAIMQDGGWEGAHVRRYLETNNKSHLYIAHEYLKTMLLLNLRYMQYGLLLLNLSNGITRTSKKSPFHVAEPIPRKNHAKI